jgi:putative PIN family toxin of toxin-antitoxin system
MCPGSKPNQAFAVARRLGLLVSEATLTELNRVLRRARLDRFTDLDTRLEFLADVVLLGDEVEIVEQITICRDPKDDKFLEVAVNGNATHLVTGDQDLLALNPFRGVAILTPADVLALVSPPDS